MTEDHTDITQLFNRNPTEMTDRDIDKIIEEMRKKRHLFKAAPSTAAAPKTLTDKQKAATKLDLGDFDLKI